MASRVTIPTTKMDVRKFLGAINDGVQAKVAVLESNIKEFGNKLGLRLKLVSLSNKHLYLEDAVNNDYYIAEHKRENGGKVTISGIQKLEIYESQKRDLFESACAQFVDAIAEGDQKSINSAFDKMASHRFTSRTIPESGVVRTKDNAIRRIAMSESKNTSILASAIADALTNNIVTEDDGTLKSVTLGQQVKIPVTEWTRARIVARTLRETAEKAYTNENFQGVVHNIAKAINSGKIAEAVDIAKPFFGEFQEFTTLTKDGIKELVGNTLATSGVFNDQLCEDTATLIYRTNLKINRDSIVTEWRKAATKTGNSALLDNVRTLEESENFETVYDEFINLIFTESMSSKDVRRDTYVTALKMLKDTAKIKDSPNLASQIDNLIENLENPADDAALIEAENLLASVKSHLANETLDDFDDIPGEDNVGGDDLGLDDTGEHDLNDLADDLGDDMDAKDNKPATTVNFNITIGGDGGVDVGGMDDDLGGDDLGDDLGGDDLGGENDDLGLGGEDDGGLDLGGDDDLGMESRKRGKPISEEQDPAAAAAAATDCEECDDDDEPSTARVNRLGKNDKKDKKKEWVKPWEKEANESFGLDYGLPPINSSDCDQVVDTMIALAESKTDATIAQLAKAAFDDCGIMVPESRMNAAIDQVSSLFEAQRKVPTKHKKHGRSRSAYCAEDQHRSPILRKMGLKKNRHTTKEIDECKWLEIEDKAALGVMNGIRFILDLDNPVAIIPEDVDNDIEIAVPDDLIESALSAIDQADGDSEPFIQWLSENVEALGDSQLDEAVASITTDPSGAITVKASPGANIEIVPDDQINDIADQMGDVPDDGMAGPDIGDLPGDNLDDGVPGDFEGEQDIPPDLDGDADQMPPGLDDGGEDSEAGLAPVNEFEPEEGGEEEDGGMPDFDGPDGVEGGEDSGKDSGEEESEEESEDSKDDESPVAEDHEITQPTAAKYNTAKQDHRKSAKPSKPGKPDGKLDGINTGSAANGTVGKGDTKLKKV